jgi:hypothetical protein
MEKSGQIIPGRRLGALPFIPHQKAKVPIFKKYSKALPPPPLNSGYVSAVPSWPMFLNDTIGDCTIAAAAHMIEQWTQYAGSLVMPSDGQVLDAYEAVSGYDPNNPASDVGATLISVLQYWKTTGIGKNTIAAWSSVDPTNRTEIQQAISIFGGVYIGLSLPIASQNPPTGVNGLPVWQATGLTGNGAPGSWGGHCIPLVGYGVDSAGNSGTMGVTWAQLYDLTYGYLAAYCTEMYAIMTQEWIEADGLSPSGFDAAQLLADLPQF